MIKNSVLVIEENDRRRKILRKKLPPTLPHCSFVFETSARERSDIASFDLYKLVLLGVGDNDDAQSIILRTYQLFGPWRGQNTILLDPKGRSRGICETGTVIRRRWFWKRAVIKAAQRYLPVRRGNEYDVLPRRWIKPPAPTVRFDRPSVLVVTFDTELVTFMDVELRRRLPNAYVNIYANFLNFCLDMGGRIEDVIVICAKVKTERGLAWKTLNESSEFQHTARVVLYDGCDLNIVNKRIAATVRQPNLDALAETIKSFLPGDH